MKILLVSPPLYRSFSPSFPPLGIGYIASVLEKHGFDIKVIDMFNFNWKKVRNTLKKEDPDILGVSCLTDGRVNAFKLIQISKQINPNVKTIIGGPHPHFMYKQILENYPIDVIVFGEGELTCLELLNTLENEGDLKNVRGIAFKSNKKIFLTGQRPPIQNLDLIPFPTYHYFNFSAYKPIEDAKRKEFRHMRRAAVITSRGCPYNCQFCSTSVFWNHCWRCRSAENVADELELLYNDFKVRYIDFADDNFAINKQRVIDVCKEIISRKLDITWITEMRVDNVDREMLRWMKRSGCHQVQYGIESGSQLILDTINKRITLNQILKAFKITKEAGIETYALLMVGNPNESERTINETVDLIRMIKPDFINVSLTTVFPGTQLYEIAKSKGLLNDNYWLSEKLAPVYTCELPIEKLEQLRFKIISEFWKSKGFYFYFKKIFRRGVLRPSRALQFISAYLKGRFRSVI